jgi:hypothetical protein
MNTVAEKDAIKTITGHYIDGAFVESLARKSWISSVRPTAG